MFLDRLSALFSCHAVLCTLSCVNANIARSSKTAHSNQPNLRRISQQGNVRRSLLLSYYVYHSCCGRRCYLYAYLFIL